MDAVPSVIREKEPIKFRPLHLTAPLNALLLALRQKQPDLEISTALRDGLEAYLPQISAYLLARQQTPSANPHLVQLTLICAKALEHGVTPEQLEAQLSSLLEQKLSA